MTRPRVVLPPMARAVVSGDRRALARAITAVENGAPEADAVLRATYARTGRVPVVGFAGPLGVGKSSLLSALVAHLRANGRKVGVIAVDPSSPFSGGSVLGDRIRFERRVDDRDVFFRSMASRGAVGGVAAATRDVARLLEAAGFDVVLIETVGSGQVDVAIREIASTRVVVVVPHLGDEVQTLKAGLFEIADVFCVNKADLPGSETAERHLAELAGLGPGPDGWLARVVRTSATGGTGLPALWAAVEEHEAFARTSEAHRQAERRRLSDEIAGRAREELSRELARRLETEPQLRRLVDEVVARRLDPRTAADRLATAARR